ncbi:MAG: type I-B CRISPR-associated endonuclease Cas1 [Candidatus Fermentithermobacillus carboniphilus]|uniref:CRISPR-associated endonuclease Cas1 n=1 Tax=Candidatus Fermentithermobacillus carboniphilus TaxID=3085328 RepID=A0AAT9LGP4_9FIRM|nr:MAG: type I-B CRISPR-associated endonuclease Cas1 [Candidatus Fermentithermobacillus carboniphilus]
MMRTMFIFSDGEFKRKDNTVMFDMGDRKQYLPIHEVDEMLIFGEVSLNKRFLELCSQNEIILHFFNFHGYYTGSFYPREHLNSGYVLLKQAEHYLVPEKRMVLAKGFVSGAVKNIRQVLKYYENRGKNLRGTLEEIESLALHVKDVNSIDGLMAIEGNIRERYYKAFDEILQNEDFVFDVRTKRPPKNYLNTLISFGNSILYTIILSEIYKTHLDPRIGYLHATNFRRFSLNLDIAEIFKPIMVDRVIFTVVNEHMVTKDDFEKEGNGVFLKESGRKAFIGELMRKLETTISHREVGRSVSYRRLIRLELYKLEKHIMEEKQYTPFVASW